ADSASLAGAAPSSPITTRTVPTGTTSPSLTRMWEIFPAAGDGISTVVLSVSISTSGSSSATSCPSATSQRATSPSVRPSPRSGSLNSYANSDSLQKAVVVGDERVFVELDVGRERPAREAHHPVAQRLVALLATLHPQLRNVDEPHRVVPGGTRVEQPVAHDRQRVEERRREDVEEVG